MSEEKIMRAKLADIVRSTRLSYKWSQSQLADFSGINRKTIIRLENNGECTLKNFTKVLYTLGLKINIMEE